MVTKDLVIEKEKELLEAMSAGNVGVLHELLAEGMQFINQDGIVISKIDDLKIHESNLLKITELEARNQNIVLFDDTAVVSVGLDFAGTYAGEAFSGKFKYGRTWKLLNDKFQLYWPNVRY